MVYLDYASTTPVDMRVLDAMIPYFRESYGNPSSVHRLGQKAEAAIEEAPTLPGSLLEAMQESESSDLLRRCLGDHVFESFLTSKRIEWERYRSHITDYELNRYLPIL